MKDDLYGWEIEAESVDALISRGARFPAGCERPRVDIPRPRVVWIRPPRVGSLARQSIPRPPLARPPGDAPPVRRVLP